MSYADELQAVYDEWEARIKREGWEKGEQAGWEKGEQAGWAARAIFAHNLEPWGRGLGGGRCWHEPGKVSSTPNTPWRLDPGGMEG